VKTLRGIRDFLWLAWFIAAARRSRRIKFARLPGLPVDGEPLTERERVALAAIGLYLDCGVLCDEEDRP